MKEALEKVKQRIQSIDNMVKIITERPFRGEEHEIQRQITVDKLMDNRDELVKERIELEKGINNNDN